MATVSAKGNGFIKLSLTALAANGTNTSESVDVGIYQVISMQMVHASHDDTSSYKWQVSNDGTNFDDLSGATGTTASASGSSSIDVEPWAYRFIRFVITDADANAASTLTAHIVAKSKGAR